MSERRRGGLTLSCLGLLPFGQAGAAGFIEDSKATLSLKNFYINQDVR
ncbi:outer membrane porin, OprD family, partial [Azotobacter vinelandii]